VLKAAVELLSELFLLALSVVITLSIVGSIVVALRAVNEKEYTRGFFGSLSPSDSGRSQRHGLQGEWHQKGANSETTLMAYGFYYDLNLFSDFTYFLVDPNKGDQFEQQDRRWAAGFDVRHTVFGRFLGRKTETTFGLGRLNAKARVQRIDRRQYQTNLPSFAAGQLSLNSSVCPIPPFTGGRKKECPFVVKVKMSLPVQTN
jgi:hypothetical protein